MPIELKHNYQLWSLYRLIIHIQEEWRIKNTLFLHVHVSHLCILVWYSVFCWAICCRSLAISERVSPSSIWSSCSSRSGGPQGRKTSELPVLRELSLSTEHEVGEFWWFTSSPSLSLFCPPWRTLFSSSAFWPEDNLLGLFGNISGLTAATSSLLSSNGRTQRDDHEEKECFVCPTSSCTTFTSEDPIRPSWGLVSKFLPAAFSIVWHSDALSRLS